MLEHSFSGCKSSSRTWYTYRELVLALKVKICTGMVGGKASDRTNHTKNTETVMDEEEEEGKRLVEDKYKGVAAHFASISLVTPPLDTHKIIHELTMSMAPATLSCFPLVMTSHCCPALESQSATCIGV